MHAPRRAVYTAVMGGYETVLSSPPTSTADCICFTDDPGLTSDRWRIELVEPVLPGDPIRSARHLKIAGHPILDAYDETLWVDNRVELLVDPVEILEDWLSDANISMPSHSYRDTVTDEFVAVLEGGFDDPSRLQEQLLHYLAHDVEALQEKPYWTAIIARRSTPEVAQAMSGWRDQVMRYSRRDQLSVNVALRRAGLAVTVQPLESGGSGKHAWRSFSDAGRRPSDEVRRALTAALIPPLARLGDLERERDESVEQVATQREAVDGLVRELGVAERERRAIDDEIQRLRDVLATETTTTAALHAEATGLRAESDDLRAELGRVATERDALGALCHDVMTSTSWRVTRPIRSIRRATRRETS